MTYAPAQLTSDGVTATFAIPFPYVAAAHIHVLDNGVAYTGAVTFDSPTVLHLTPVPAAGHVVTIYRVTPVDAATVTFAGGSLASADLNSNTTQLLYRLQELGANPNPLTVQIITNPGGGDLNSTTVATLLGSSLLTALNTSSNTVVYAQRGSIYLLDTPIVVPAGKTLNLRGATLQAASGYSANYLVELKDKAFITSGVVDGTNMPAPSAVWAGSGVPIGTGIMADGSSVTCNDVQITDIIGQNLPSGLAFFRSVKRYRVKRCQGNTVQTHVAHLTSGVVETFNCSYGRVRDLEVNGYNWKGVNFGNDTFSKCLHSHFYGAGQNAGHAVFYMDGASDCLFQDCNHEGLGYCIKDHAGARNRFVRITGNGSSGLAYMQASSDFLLDHCTHLPDVNSIQSVIVEGIAPVVSPATAGGPSIGGRIIGLTSRRTPVGTTLNHVGIQLLAVSGYPIQDLTIRDCTLDGHYESIAEAYVASASLDRIKILHNRLLNSTLTTISLYPNSGTLQGNTIIQTANGPCCFLGQPTGTTGATIMVDSNQTRGFASGDHWQIGNGLFAPGSPNWKHVSFTNNHGDGGNNLLNWDVSANAGDKCDVLTLQGNKATNLLAPGSGGTLYGLNLNFGTANATSLDARGNALMDTTGALKALSLTTNAARVAARSVVNENRISGVTNRTNVIFPFEDTAFPAAGAWLQGDRVKNTNVAAAGPPGWVCTTAGTPGTFKAEANVAA